MLKHLGCQGRLLGRSTLKVQHTSPRIINGVPGPRYEKLRLGNAWDMDGTWALLETLEALEACGGTLEKGTEGSERDLANGSLRGFQMVQQTIAWQLEVTGAGATFDPNEVK